MDRSRVADMSVGRIWAHLRTNPLETWAWLGLAVSYARCRLPWHFRYASTQAVRCDPLAEGAVRDLAAVSAWPAERVCWDFCADLGQGGPMYPAHLAECEFWLDILVSDAPDDWLSWVYLARCAELSPDVVRERVREAVRQAIALEPVAGETGYLLARWRFRSGDAYGALNALQATLQQAPERYGSWLLQGQIHLQLGNEAAAKASLQRAGQARHPGTLLELARTLFTNNYWQESIRLLEAAVDAYPGGVALWRELAILRTRTWDSKAARQCWEKVIELQPGDAEALHELARGSSACLLCGRDDFELRRAAFEAANSDLSRGDAMNLLLDSLYQDHLDAAEIVSLHRQVGEMLYPAVPVRNFAMDRGADRRLRVGYVTGDLFRQHPVGIFMLPVLERHNREEFRTFVYFTGQMRDECTQRAGAAVDCWREVAHWDDSTLHRAILDDRIDVLVDLAGFTTTHRLGVFAARSAPVQISYLGYPHSTGVPSMDWFVADDVVVPVGDEALFSERVARLPGPVFCWAPTEEFPLAADGEVPVRGTIVFGSFNNLHKLSGRTVALWAKVLAAVPDSILLLKAPQLLDPVARDLVVGMFGKHGIDASRIEMRGPTELGAMMKEYHDVHVALDPLPYNGGTTSLQALWMGCPLVTMAGGNFVSRMGASFLTSLGREEWIAQDEAGYVRVAVDLAREMIASSPWSRHELRNAMRASPLCDIGRHVAALEAIYRNAWDEWQALNIAER